MRRLALGLGHGRASFVRVVQGWDHRKPSGGGKPCALDRPLGWGMGGWHYAGKAGWSCEEFASRLELSFALHQPPTKRSCVDSHTTSVNPISIPIL